MLSAIARPVRECVRACVRRPFVQQRCCFLSSCSYKRIYTFIFKPPNSTHGETGRWKMEIEQAELMLPHESLTH